MTTPLSRRSLLRAGTAALAATALTRSAWGAEWQETIFRKIPSTGERLPVIGIGTSNFKEVADMKAVLARMQQLGGTVIDTAALYGNVEEMLGTALADLQLRDKMFVETKFNTAGVSFGPPGAAGPAAGAAPPAFGSPPPGAPTNGAPGNTPASPAGAPRFAPPADTVSGLESFERSLKRLQTERVDLLMAHLPASWEPLIDIMIEQKKRGRTRYIGITTTAPNQHAAMVEFMEKHPIDFIQVDYSLDDRVAAKDVFPVAIQRKVAVMVAVPFGGRFNQLLKKTEGAPLPPWAAEFDAHSWAQVLLKYAIAHPAVTCAVPGATKVSHLEDNLAASRGRLPNEKMKAKLEAYWDEAVGSHEHS